MTGADRLRCANCGTPHGPDDIFCEKCGYDFITGSLPGPLEEFAAPPPSVDPPTVPDPGRFDPPGGLDPARFDPPVSPDPRRFDPPAAPDPRRFDPPSGPGNGAPSAPPPSVPGPSPLGAAGADPASRSATVSAPAATPSAPGSPRNPGGVRLEQLPDPAGAPGPLGAPDTGQAGLGAPSTQPTAANRIGAVVIDVAVHRAYFESVVSEGELSFPQPPPIPQRLEVVGPEIHIGRTSQGRAIHPDLDLAALTGDPAVSSRHAVLRLDPSGTMTVTDVGSTNGTYIGSFDGTPIAPGMAHLLLPGGVVFLGAWTALTVMLA